MEGAASGGISKERTAVARALDTGSQPPEAGAHWSLVAGLVLE